MSNKLTRLLAVIFALALLATACGSGSDGDVVDNATDAAAEETEEAAPEEEEEEEEAAAEPEEEEATGGAAADEEVDDAVEEAAEEEVEDGGVVTTAIEDLEAEWAEQRAGIVAEIKAAGYGVDGTTLNGPGGWTVDLTECPADWSDNAGVADGTIKIGHTTAQSGSLAAYGNIGVGMDAYFDYVNQNGGIGPDGLQIELIMKDDAYVATQTQELVAELLQSEDPFYIQTLGSPNTFAVQGTMNENCVPQPLSMTGHQAWGDPDNNPWTTGLQLSYATESLLWGSWIESNLPAGAKVAALVMDNDFGLAYEQGFADYAENSDHIGDVTFVRHDPAAATLTNEMTTLAASGPDIFIAMTAGNPCLLAVEEAARTGITDIAVTFMPSVCKAVSAYMAPAGEAAADWYIFGGGWKDSTDSQYESDSYISWMNDRIEEAGLDSAVSLYATGYGQFGWPAVQALQIAAELEGGLTRTNYMIAVRSLRMDHPALLEGIAFGQNGSADAYLVEGSDLSQFDYDNQSWVIEGGVIDLDGKSANCAWVAGEGC
ncbi:MAG: ABC transporter substrate-binding protein [Acidimicrobiaceae bacterium]|nr:ABC transporter substrate-binding protein [Acidimicrobiaceae bacterium]